MAADGSDITGATLVDGQTFSVSDGNQKVTFEFDTGNGVRTGNVAIVFAPGDSAATIASKVVGAINNPVSGATTYQLSVHAAAEPGNPKGVWVGRSGRGP